MNNRDYATFEDILANLEKATEYQKGLIGKPIEPRAPLPTALEQHLSIEAHGHPYGPVILHPDDVERFKKLIGDETE